MESEEKFINILKENLLFMRHQETQRMWIANVFVAIVVGFLAYVGKNGLASISWYVYLTLTIISLLCLLITLKLNHVFTKTKDATKAILNSRKVSLGRDWKRYMVTLESTGLWKVLKVSYLYDLLYTISISAAIFLMIKPSVCFLCRLLAAAIPLFVCITLVYIDLRRKEQET
jgi:hypothetical protein